MCYIPAATTIPIYSGLMEYEQGHTLRYYLEINQ